MLMIVDYKRIKNKKRIMVKFLINYNSRVMTWNDNHVSFSTGSILSTLFNDFMFKSLELLIHITTVHKSLSITLMDMSG